jgi:hypothetical protein
MRDDCNFADFVMVGDISLPGLSDQEKVRAKSAI